MFRTAALLFLLSSCDAFTRSRRDSVRRTSSLHVCSGQEIAPASTNHSRSWEAYLHDYRETATRSRGRTDRRPCEDDPSDDATPSAGSRRRRKHPVDAISYGTASLSVFRTTLHN